MTQTKWFDGDVDSLGECGVDKPAMIKFITRNQKGAVQRFRAPIAGPGGAGNGLFWYQIKIYDIFIIEKKLKKIRDKNIGTSSKLAQ